MIPGYLALEKADPSILPASQEALLRGRGAVWGRTLACRLLGAPAPRYKGMATFRHWWSVLTLGQKLRTFGGTVRRILRGGLRGNTSQEHGLPLRGKAVAPESQGKAVEPEGRGEVVAPEELTADV